ncbi:putative ankyrin repeat protein RF_0381 isoform X2 [Leptopilina heterotoma]|nr:putative ankyrin repeat protein RF_0381 isoform X2 [Leptopilina heterotoma]
MLQLRCAINEGNAETVKELLQKEININDQDRDGKTILYHAVNAGNLLIVEEILKYRPDINEEKYALHIAVENGHKEIVELLLEPKFGAEINCKNDNGNTPLYVSARKGNTEIFKMLLIKGADINEVNCIQETALSIAAKKGHEEIVKLLLEPGNRYNSNVPS